MAETGAAVVDAVAVAATPLGYGSERLEAEVRGE
jgi:hypothetical protein